MIENIPSHSSWYLFFFTNIVFLSSLAAAWLIFSVVLSIKTKDWHWFARAGAVLVIVGGVLSFRSSLRYTAEERVRIRHMSIVERFTDRELSEQERDSVAIIIGIILMVGGTLTWAYGDLLGVRRGSTLSDDSKHATSKPPKLDQGSLQ